MGISNFTSINFDLALHFTNHPDLSILVEPFSRAKIDAVVKSLPSDKAPGPNRFNIDFIKHCCPIIYEYFYRSCEDFYSDHLCLHSINGSHITIIPKKDDAQRISDYRPISLLSTSVKIITKLLAYRLQTVLSSLFHKNQYGFIKHRTIQDYIAWALEFLHM